MTTIGENVHLTSRIAIGKADIGSKLETSIPDGALSLDSILSREELHNRPARPADYEGEHSALVALITSLTDSPRTIWQTLAYKVLGLLHADSAGLSLLTRDEKRFYWAAIAGAYRAMLFAHWEQRRPYLKMANPPAEEGLLFPFYVNGKAVGTIWAIAHGNRRKFDAEDLRLLESMGRFASAAYKVVGSIDDPKLGSSANRVGNFRDSESDSGM
jgi:hypothetical protein